MEAFENRYIKIPVYQIIIRQVNVLQYNTLNSTLTYYFEIRQAIGQLK